MSVLASAIQTECNLAVEVEGIPFKGIGDTEADINAISENMFNDILSRIRDLANG